MATAAIIVSAVLFLAMGVFGLVAPTALVAPFGIALGGADGKTEVRAVYGGFGVAVAVLLGLAACGLPGLRPGAVVGVAAGLLGMAFGRLVARGFERPSGFYPTWFYFWVEVAAGAALLAAA
ncbi:DUF4345 family protein [Mycolicibacter minnesotensis]